MKLLRFSCLLLCVSSLSCVQKATDMNYTNDVTALTLLHIGQQVRRAVEEQNMDPRKAKSIEDILALLDQCGLLEGDRKNLEHDFFLRKLQVKWFDQLCPRLVIWSVANGDGGIREFGEGVQFVELTICTEKVDGRLQTLTENGIPRIKIF